jgi:ketosteroid isomerase-like protein
MSQENVQLIRGVFEGWDAAGVEGMLKFFHDDVDYLPIEEDDVIHGHEELRRYFSRWMEPWEDFQVAPTDFVASGDHVVNGASMHGRGRGSGIQTSMEYWQAWTIREGKVARWEEHFERRAALEAVGLSD